MNTVPYFVFLKSTVVWLQYRTVPITVLCHRIRSDLKLFPYWALQM
jgi:hypothetical protein